MNKTLDAPQDSTLLSEINITPLTDVLLVLLIIFMILAALLTPPGFEKRISNPGKLPTTAISVHRLAVSIDRQGRIAFNGAHVSTQGLYAAMARAGAKTHIALYADARSPYGLALRVLDAAKDAGISDVSFVTQ